MLNTADIIAFVATADSPRALAFYQDVLGLTVVEDNPFALVLDANGVMLRIQKMPSVTPASHTVLGWTVTDIRRTVAGLTAKGVQFERYPPLPQDEAGVWVSPSGAHIAWFKDPDGNLLSLTQF